MLVIFGIILGALGNRCWGWEHGNRIIAVFLMTAGIIIIQPSMALLSPIIFGLIWIFRMFGTGETWLAFQEGRNRMKAIIRGAAILPLAAFLTEMTGEWWHLIIGMCFPVIAFTYYFCGKLKVKDPTKYAELLTGSYIALVGI